MNKKNFSALLLAAILITQSNFCGFVLDSIIDDALTAPATQCAPNSGFNYGQFCFQNIDASSTSPILLDEVIWDGCTNNYPHITLTRGQAYNTSWGMVPFSENCRLKQLRFQVQDGTHYVYILDFNNVLVPQYGAMKCVVSPTNQANPDRNKFISCATIDRDLNTTKFTSSN